MIVTIDGPAGAGKSSVARAVANRLGYQFLDTGAMYRAVAWAGLQAGIRLDDERALAETAQELQIRFHDDAVFVNDQDVTAEIRSPNVTAAVKHAASNAAVREQLVEQQRRIGQAVDHLVTEGRDQGSVVFPEAECKIFLTATPEERARRRYQELLRAGQKTTYSEVLETQNQRDASDQARVIAPLVKPDDAVEVYTDDMNEEQVVTHLVWIIQSMHETAP